MFHHQHPIIPAIFLRLNRYAIKYSITNIYSCRYEENNLLHWPHCSLEEAINRLIGVPRLLAVFRDSIAFSVLSNASANLCLPGTLQAEIGNCKVVFGSMES